MQTREKIPRTPIQSAGKEQEKRYGGTEMGDNEDEWDQNRSTIMPKAPPNTTETVRSAAECLPDLWLPSTSMPMQEDLHMQPEQVGMRHFCTLHGYGGHATGDCRLRKRIMKLAMEEAEAMGYVMDPPTCIGCKMQPTYNGEPFEFCTYTCRDMHTPKEPSQGIFDWRNNARVQRLMAQDVQKRQRQQSGVSKARSPTSPKNPPMKKQKKVRERKPTREVYSAAAAVEKRRETGRNTTGQRNYNTRLISRVPTGRAPIQMDPVPKRKRHGMQRTITVNVEVVLSPYAQDDIDERSSQPGSLYHRQPMRNPVRKRYMQGI